MKRTGIIIVYVEPFKLELLYGQLGPRDTHDALHKAQKFLRNVLAKTRTQLSATGVELPVQIQVVVVQKAPEPEPGPVARHDSAGWGPGQV